MTPPDDPAATGKDDQTTLYSLAANCSLYEEDDQPPRLNVGSEREPRMVSSTEAWRDFYARNLVEQFDARVSRLLVAREWAVQRRETAPAVPSHDPGQR